MPQGNGTAPAGMTPLGPVPGSVPSASGDGIAQLKVPLVVLAASFLLGLVLSLGLCSLAQTPAQIARQVGLPEGTYFVDEDNGDISVRLAAFSYTQFEDVLDRCGFDGDLIVDQVYATTQYDGEQVRTAGPFTVTWRVTRGQLDYFWIMKE